MNKSAPTIRPHWNYFLAIERDLEVLSRYVEFDPRNFDCFSIEIARILLAAGAEVDVVSKQICRMLNTSTTADGINSYRDELTTAFPDIPAFEVIVPRYGLTLQPWDEWNAKGGVPAWWTAYNKVKHHRDSHYHSASLRNALDAIGGLYVVVLYLYKSEAESGSLSPGPQLLLPGAKHRKGSVTTVRPMYRL